LDELDIDIAKIASQDAKSWTLIEEIVKLKKPTIISNGGTDIEDLDKVVELFEEYNVPLAINHCVSLYPSEDAELELNQIDYLRRRYPNHVIGFSTHEYNDWKSSILIAYAKGASTFERHVDIDDSELHVSPYCSLPKHMDEWFAAFKKAKEMIGGSSHEQREIKNKERKYVISVSRGAYALRDLPKGYKITKEKLGKDFTFAIPLQDGQFSARDIDKKIVLKKPVKKDSPIPLN
jgi:N-acetylneuraminate synthase